MPIANQNFTLKGKQIRVGDKVRTIPKGLERLFELEDNEQEGDV